MDKSKEEIKKEKREREKIRLSQDLIKGNIKNTKQRVAYLLNRHPYTRNSDKHLAWRFWSDFEHAGSSVNFLTFSGLTKYSSIVRARAKIQNEYKLFKASDVVKKFREDLDKTNRDEQVADKPGMPMLNIFIDESGKNEKYLIVGSLWMTNMQSSTFAYFKLLSWKEEQKINYEFHFSKLNKNKLDQYKAFFAKFISLYTDSAFKAIVIDRSGSGNVQEAITALTFHLLNKGIEHENESGRAPLPRMLKVTMDADTPGGDQIKMLNIRERLNAAKLQGLYVSDIDVGDSEQDLQLQIVDLFVASVNRKLNFPESDGKPKDEFANYILKIVGLDINQIDKSVLQPDSAKIFDYSW